MEYQNDKYIIGENGTAMLKSTGDLLLDLFSSSTRIDITKITKQKQKQNQDKTKTDLINQIDLTEINRFNTKLDQCLANYKDLKTNKDSLQGLKYFIIHGFYMRDIKEKGERILFDLFYIRLFKYSSELAKELLKFIVGTDDTEYFGSFKDLHQILELASITNIDKDLYMDMYNSFLEFESKQLYKDWKIYTKYKGDVLLKQSQISKPKISLCAKWLVSANKHYDLNLKLNDKSYMTNFCELNAQRIIKMNNLAKSLPCYNWKKVNSSNYIGLKCVMRKIKSALGAYLDIPEVKMCSKQWSNINISNVPARNMTKHRLAFNNELTPHSRKTQTQCQPQSNLFGDRYLTTDMSEQMVNELTKLCDLMISEPTMAAQNVINFKTKFHNDIMSSNQISTNIDRIICRFNVGATLLNTTKSVHGARSDLNDLIKAARNISNCNLILDPSKINEWVGQYPERALLHKQIHDKIDSIQKAIDDSLTKLDQEQNDLSHEQDQSQPKTKPFKINLKRTIGLYDVSGSMEGTPMNICIGMAYCISHLTFDKTNNKFPLGITFESKPQFFELKTDMDFVSACHYIQSQPWGSNTNFVAAYKLLLSKAIDNTWTQEQMPQTMIIFSDMQFDQAENRESRFETMYQTLKCDFESHGYELPLLVFWNLNGKYNGQSVSSSTIGTITISGYDPSIFKAITESESIISKSVDGKISSVTPFEMMIKCLNRDRYKQLADFIDNCGLSNIEK
jgi:hypothetical protein